MKHKPKSAKVRQEISSYFETLNAAWGPQHWWPGESPFEVIVGAILTQNTAWTNVDKALTNMRSAGALSIEGVRNTAIEDLEQMLRPSGYFRQKANRLKAFVAWLDEKHGGQLDEMFARATANLRTELLSIKGIGPETADSILLYAGQHEIFVVDAYTRRIFERHGLISPDATYESIREMVESALETADLPEAEPSKMPSSTSVEPGPGPAEEVVTPVVHPPSAMSEAPRSELAQRYNQFHALLVQVAKHYCQSRIARCERCPLRIFLASGGPPKLSKSGKPTKQGLKFASSATFGAR